MDEPFAFLKPARWSHALLARVEATDSRRGAGNKFPNKKTADKAVFLFGTREFVFAKVPATAGAYPINFLFSRLRRSIIDW